MQLFHIYNDASSIICTVFLRQPSERTPSFQGAHPSARTRNPEIAARDFRVRLFERPGNTNCTATRRPVLTGIKRAVLARSLGWVERNETHRLARGDNGGFRCSLPTLRTHSGA